MIPLGVLASRRASTGGGDGVEGQLTVWRNGDEPRTFTIPASTPITALIVTEYVNSPEWTYVLDRGSPRAYALRHAGVWELSGWTTTTPGAGRNVVTLADGGGLWALGARHSGTERWPSVTPGAVAIYGRVLTSEERDLVLDDLEDLVGL